MKKYENLPIKDLIKQDPEVLDIINEYKLPCKTCKNNCLVRNIPEMESFSLQKEVDFTKKILEIEK